MVHLEHGEVEKEDIVKGCEFEKDRCVVGDEAGLQKITLETTRTIDLMQFVDASEVDSICQAVRIRTSRWFRKPTQPRKFASGSGCLQNPCSARWEQFGLIRPVHGHYDFQDLVSLRTLAELVERGVRPEIIAKSLLAALQAIPSYGDPHCNLGVML
jgi:hypothetical protein